MSHRLQFSDDHPALPGHFPGNPVIPGVVLLDHIMIAAGDFLSERDGGRWRVTQAPAVKFLRPLAPQTPVEIHFDGPPEKLRFKAVMAQEPDSVVVTGTLSGSPG